MDPPDELPPIRLPPRLPVGLRARDRASARRAARQGASLGPQQLHRGRDLRESRPLRGALPPSGPSLLPPAPQGRKGRRRVRADRLGRRAGRDRREPAPRRAKAWRGGGLALLVRRHHGAGPARRHPAADARQALLALQEHDLRHALGHWLSGRARQALGRARDRDRAACRSGRGVGHEPGAHPCQPDEPRRPGPQGAGRSWS